MSTGVPDDLDKMLAASGVFVQAQLFDEMAGLLFMNIAFIGGLNSSKFSRLHSQYRPVPEVYLTADMFDTFSPPQAFLRELRDELGEDTDPDLFLEGLGCFVELDWQERNRLCATLRLSLPSTPNKDETPVVLMCSERIERAANKLRMESTIGLLHAVRFHEHSHAARANKLLRAGRAEVRRGEETVAQWEAYMFLRASGEDHAIESMRKLMAKQPLCYQIPIP